MPNEELPVTVVSQDEPGATAREESVPSIQHTDDDPHTCSVSIIIPSCAKPYSCLAVLAAINDQTKRPLEVIIVDSSGATAQEWDRIKPKISARLSECLRIHHVQSTAFPGRARNIGGRLAEGDWIAYLDVNTLPAPNWLESSITAADSSGTLGCWGSTKFRATSTFAELLRDGIYGAHGRRTLPGSVLHRSVNKAVGQFIEWVRAAEDSEWIARALTLGVPVIDSPEGTINYVGMSSISPSDALHKWLRNYVASQMLQHLRFQKVIAWLALYGTLVTFAFNWNAIAAGWQTDSPLYVDHITKIASLAPVWVYILFRGAWLPCRRGVPWRRLLPLRFILIAFVCLLLDGTKALAFLVGRRQVRRFHDVLV